MYTWLMVWDKQQKVLNLWTININFYQKNFTFKTEDIGLHDYPNEFYLKVIHLIKRSPKVTLEQLKFWD